MEVRGEDRGACCVILPLLALWITELTLALPQVRAVRKTERSAGNKPCHGNNIHHA